MAAFERIKSGIPEMDAALDNIRLGDNVVWRVSEQSQFKLFMEPYIRQAKGDGSYDGEFFRVTCPFLFILDTVTFFPIIRGKHSVRAVNKILNTTQLFFDVYSDRKNIYVRPEKVWNSDPG